MCLQRIAAPKGKHDDSKRMGGSIAMICADTSARTVLHTIIITSICRFLQAQDFFSRPTDNRRRIVEETDDRVSITSIAIWWKYVY